jgi:hypothetical protein
MEPDEAAPILAKFADTLDLEMSGKFWAPSEYRMFTYAPMSRGANHDQMEQEELETPRR